MMKVLPRWKKETCMYFSLHCPAVLQQNEDRSCNRRSDLSEVLFCNEDKLEKFAPDQEAT